MARGKNEKQRDVLAELFANRDKNIESAKNWTIWEIQDQLKRVEAAKESFLLKDPNHDVSIVNEHIEQLTQSLKIKSGDVSL
jgi:hypothetical protein